MGLLEELGINRRELIACPNNCGKHSKMGITEEAEKLPTGIFGIYIHVLLPIWRCSVCGCEWLDGRGDHIAGNALDAFYKRKLTPTELKMIRRELDMTQQELADVIGWTKLSIVRWEGGKLEQSLAADRLYRVLDHELVKKLKAQTPRE